MGNHYLSRDREECPVCAVRQMTGWALRNAGLSSGAPIFLPRVFKYLPAANKNQIFRSFK